MKKIKRPSSKRRGAIKDVWGTCTGIDEEESAYNVIPNQVVKNTNVNTNESEQEETSSMLKLNPFNKGHFMFNGQSHPAELYTVNDNDVRGARMNVLELSIPLHGSPFSSVSTTYSDIYCTVTNIPFYHNSSNKFTIFSRHVLDITDQKSQDTATGW